MSLSLDTAPPSSAYAVPRRTARGPARDPSYALEIRSKFNDLIANGHLREAVTHLERNVRALRGAADDVALAYAYRSIALCHGVLGHPEDAGDACRDLLALRATVSGDTLEGIYESARVSNLVLRGSPGRARSIAERVLRNIRLAPGIRAHLTLSLAHAYWQSGNTVSALIAVQDVWTQPGITQNAPRAVCAQLLRGQILFWHVIQARTHHLPDQAREDAPLIDPASGRVLVKPEEIAHLAREAFSSAHRHAQANPNFIGLARTGLAAVSALGSPNPGEMTALEQQLRWLTKIGLCNERDFYRLAIGALHRLHGNNKEARAWLMPLANQVLEDAERPFAKETLRLCSGACESSGDFPTALRFLRAFLSTRSDPSHGDLDGGEASRFFKRAKTYSGRTEITVGKLIRILDLNPERRHDIGSLAAALGLCRRSFESHIRLETGMGPRRFINNVRLEWIRAYLHSNDVLHEVTAEECATQFGFSGRRTFYAAAKLEFGKTPPDDPGRWGPRLHHGSESRA